jgi:nitroreductase
MSGETLTGEELAPLFEAARWAPSSYNAQPWRFMYALKGDEHFDAFFDLLVEGNQEWAKSAGALLVIASRSRFEHNEKDSITHSFDTGAAWMSIALQAHQNGLVAHGMQGFDYSAARGLLGLPAAYRIEAMVALGKPGSVADLAPHLQEREKPSARKATSEFVFNGPFAG